MAPAKLGAHIGPGADRLQALLRIGLTEPRDVMHSSPISAPPWSILVNGPKGVGKTTLIEQACQEHGAQVYHIGLPELCSEVPGRLDVSLRRLMSRIPPPPCVVLLEPLHEIFPRGGDPRLAFLWVELCDAVRSAQAVVVGLTDDTSLVDASVVSSFEDTAELFPPDDPQRLALLQELRAWRGLSITDDTLSAVAQRTHGFVLADLIGLLHAASRAASQSSSPLSLQHFDMVIKDFRALPARSGAAVQRIATVGWDDVGGLGDVKVALRELVLSMTDSEAYARVGVEPSIGALLYGPPGTGKTMLARAVATQADAGFLSVAISDIIHGAVGETEKALRAVFRAARRAQPCVIFLDEIDALFGKKSMGGGGAGVEQQLISALIVELDDLAGARVRVLAATNAPTTIDPAILRPGRLDTQLYVPPPDMSARRDMLTHRRRAMVLDEDAVPPADLIEKTDGFTGADLDALCRRAAIEAFNRNMADDTQTGIKEKDFESALKFVKPSVPPLLVEEFSRLAL